MAIRACRLTLTLRPAGPDAGTTRQTVTIATETTGEAVELARDYCSGLPNGAVCSAVLTDAAGAVLWSEQEICEAHP